MNVTNLKNKRRELIMAGILMMTFLVQFFNNILHTISPFLGIVLLLTFTNVFLDSKFKIRNLLSVNLVWGCSLIAMLMSYIPADRAISVFEDLIVFLCGLLIIGTSGKEPRVFRKGFSVIKVMSLFYSVSVWIQLVLPPVYRIYLRFLSEKDRASVLDLRATEGYLTGFSTNPGFTAGHIVVGIFCCIAFFNKNKKTDIMMLGFLMMSLLLTQKRSTLIFVAAVLVMVFLLSADSQSSKIKRYLLIFGGMLCAVIAFMLFGELLAKIPGLSRIVNTVNGFLMGEDVTSNRSVYYAHAWKLFKQNKVFGIGWGGFRKSTLGVITWVNTVEVHNIYLQMLTEMGIVGFTLMMITMVTILVSTIRLYLRSRKTPAADPMWKSAILFSMCYQTYFLLQGIAENSLYDINYFLMYLTSCAIFAVCNRSYKSGNCSDMQLIATIISYINGEKSLWAKRNLSD